MNGKDGGGVLALLSFASYVNDYVFSGQIKQKQMAQQVFDFFRQDTKLQNFCRHIEGKN